MFAYNPAVRPPSGPDLATELRIVCSPTVFSDGELWEYFQNEFSLRDHLIGSGEYRPICIVEITHPSNYSYGIRKRFSTRKNVLTKSISVLHAKKNYEKNLHCHQASVDLKREEWRMHKLSSHSALTHKIGSGSEGIIGCAPVHISTVHTRISRRSERIPDDRRKEKIHLRAAIVQRCVHFQCRLMIGRPKT